MEKTSYVVWALCTLVVAMPIMVQSIAKDPKAVEEWFQNLPYKKEKVTKLHFYFHDTVMGNNITAYQIAQSNITSTSPTNFGFLFMADDRLTIGPEPDSQLLGRIQGIYGSTSLEEFSFLMYFNMIFTDKIYNGSTLTLLGRNPIYHEYREMSIVGGSGVFRLARGIATAKTYSLNGLNGIIEYHVVVIHY